MNTRFKFITFFFLLSYSAFTQKIYQLSLSEAWVNVPDAEIYVESVLDERWDQTSIG